MSRLSRYFVGQFFAETFGLVVVVVPLIYFVQCFRMLDLVAVKGQDIVTLFGQAGLSIPLITQIFLYLCTALGLMRVLTAMQQTGELHLVHSAGRLSPLFGSALGFALAITLGTLALTHWITPLAMHRSDDWSTEIAADIVGRALTPHRFAEVVPGVTVVIGGRQGQGQISDFFADDQRDPLQRRTYSASSAVLSEDDAGYILQMQDGAIQYMTQDMRFSEIRFQHYDLAVDLLTTPAASGNVPTWTLVEEALRTNHWEPYVVVSIMERSADGLRVLGISLLVLAIAGFPHGRRRTSGYLELLVIGIAFADRGVTSYAPQWLGAVRPLAGGIAMTAMGLAILVWRMWFADRVGDLVRRIAPPRIA